MTTEAPSGKTTRQPTVAPSTARQEGIDNEEILKNDIGISTAPPDSPAEPAQPAPHDFMVYQASGDDGLDCTNQHFLVVPLNNGDFLATWTMSSLEGSGDQHVVIARSTDAGKTWTKPQYFAGPNDDGYIASWAFPFVVPHTGRVYMFYNKQRGYIDFHHQWTGQMWFQYSDDHGHTWSQPYTHLKMAPNSWTNADNPNADDNWIIYQSPMITSAGEVMVGLTHIGSRTVFGGEGLDMPSEVRFIRFDNILTETDPARLTITTYPENNADGLRLTDPQNPNRSCCEEATIVNLSDGRLLAVMRNNTGYIAYSISADQGRNWTEPQRLCFCPDGPGIPQPIAPAPLYQLRDGRFLLIHHNNDGAANHGRYPADWCRNRRPVYVTVGREIPNAAPDQQPLIFTQPQLLADNDRVPISRKQLTEIGTYPSLFEHNNQVFFFFPDRKHYLLGMTIPPALINDALLPR